MSDTDLLQDANAVLDRLNETANLQDLYLGRLSELARRMRDTADKIEAYADSQLATAANNELDRIKDNPR